MSVRSQRRALFLAILVLGAYSQIVQALLIRESLVVFYGNEIGLGAFYGSWLFWIALGSAAMVRWRNAGWVARPLPALRLLILLLPLLLAVQIVALRSARYLLDVSPTQLVPLGQLFLSLFLDTLPSGLAIGLAFPMACKLLEGTVEGEKKPQAVRTVSWLYVADAAGALLGGVAFTFVLIQWFGVWRTLGAVTLALAAVEWRLVPEGARRWRVALATLALSGAALTATPAGESVSDFMERLRFATLQPGLELLDAVETRYGHRALARLGKQYSLVEDGRIAATFPLPRETAMEAAFLYSETQGARRILMFGGLASGLVAELLRYPLERLDLVEQDRRAFEMLKRWLPPADRQALRDPRLHLHFQDGRRFANRLSPKAGYDLVLALDATPTSAWSNRYFTVEFYRALARAMSPAGVFCTRLSSASNYLGREVRSYTGSVYHTLRSVFPEVALRPGDRVTFCASRQAGVVSEEPDVLKARYLAVALEPRRFPAEGFRSLLPPGRVAWLRERLESEPGEIDRDAAPVTYYLNMLLWGKFSASWFVERLEGLRRIGPWPWLLPPALLALLWMLRAALEGEPRERRQRGAATQALAALGLIAMAIQLTLLFSYQSHVGFMFGRIALLNGLFMTGLALGAGFIGLGLTRSRRSSLLLALLLGLVGVALWFLPSLLDMVAGTGGDRQETIYLALCLAAGLATGIGFPLAAAVAHRETGEVVATSGLVQAADNFGGALGGALTGALLVPLMGVAGTSRLLAGLALLATLPLLFALYAPSEIPALRVRGGRAFPWSPLGWILTFLVLLQFGWHLAERARRPPPLVHFDTRLLEEVSGSHDFLERESPFVHYLGAGRSGRLPDSPETATLSTLAAAPEVRGYAGPLNLLVSVDHEGRLRGVRYIDSEETPSYIADIGRWLAGLAGLDLSQRGLDLRRVDALTGATVSSRAALEAINRSVRAAGRVAFNRELAGAGGSTGPPAWLKLKFLATLALLLLFFPVYLRGGETARLAFMAASVGLLGLWFNTLVTEIDLVNLSEGHWPSWSDNPQRWLLLGFTAFAGLLFGQVWCGYLCPFGALQEFVSRFGRWLGLRRYAHRALDRRLRFLKFVLLALLLSAVWWSGDSRWATFDPMQYAFDLPWQGWAAALVVLSLAASLFFVRFWCRYLCPMGAFLALSNKLALLQYLAPQRRFDRCDLGVREEYDIDCIRCNRCLTGRDYGIGHRSWRGRAEMRPPTVPPPGKGRSMVENPTPGRSGRASGRGFDRNRSSKLVADREV